MMKVSVITRHGITNYGSILQTYATQTVLERLGCQVEIVDYIRTDEEDGQIAKTLARRSKRWGKSAVTRGIYSLIQLPEYKIMGRKFETMRKKLLKMTRRYHSLEELMEDIPDADVYCSGSDQVWGPVGDGHLDPAYVLAYVPEEKRKIAYAGSFGKTRFAHEEVPVFQSYIKRYQAIGVREKSAVELLRQMGVHGEQVLDPTLLLTKQDWEGLISDPIKKKYILIYQLHRNKKMDQYARQMAQKAGLPLVRITPSPHHMVRGGQVVLLPDPGRFLAYLRDAEFLITDSFHGTAFAINFGTQFVNVLPGETRTRNQSLLELTGLADRVVTDFDDVHWIDEAIDYEPVQEILQQQREASLAWLQEALGENRKELT